MSDNKIRKGCDGKVKHPNETAVKEWIEMQDKVGIEDYYLSKFCNNYHTFTVPGRKKLSEKKSFRLSSKLYKLGPRKMKLNGRNRNGHKRNR